MGNFFTSSVGKKFIMSVTGIFLILFLLVHLTVNSLLLVGSEAFNEAAHFMVTNPLIRIIEPVLALGFIIHIIYSGYITLQNQTRRPIHFKVLNRRKSSTWPSRNMFILGGVVLIFLVIHLADFYWKVRFGEISLVRGTEMKDLYSLVSEKFIELWWLDLIYVIGAVFLGLHLSHGFWSAFHTLGWNNDTWMKRIQWIGYILAVIIGAGFATIPLYFLITYN